MAARACARVARRRRRAAVATVTEPEHRSTPGAAPVGGIRLATPGDWFDLDLDPRTSEASIRQLVRERAPGRHPDQVAQRRELTELLVQATRQARLQGAVLASVLATMMGDRPVSADLLAAVTPVVGDVDLPALGDRLAAEAGPSEQVREVDLIELPVGPALRVRKGVRPTVLGREVDTEVVQHFVPVPGGDRMVVLTFSTPVVVLADAFAELFDAIAESLRFTP